MMNGSEFRGTREALGLSVEWLADHLNINPRTVERWEHGQAPVRDFARLALLTLEDQADREVAEHAPDPDMPPAWQRRIIWRATRGDRS